jgi:hypothetical protein
VRSFQSIATITIDGIAGHDTLSQLDRMLPAAAPPKAPPTPPPTPVPSPYPSSHDFKIGTDDPPMRADKGAGKWNSKPKTALSYAAMVGIFHALPFARVALGKDAVKHMEHFFDNDGKRLTIDVESMIAQSKSAQRLFLMQVGRMKGYIESLSPGTFYVTSRHGTQGYVRRNDSKNWFYAVGGYTAWTKGKVDISSAGKCRLELEYKVWDRYNWDGGKQTHFALPFDQEVTITDDQMAEFHREGLAQEYQQEGSVRRSLSWNKGQIIPPAQLI